MLRKLKNKYRACRVYGYGIVSGFCLLVGVCGVKNGFADAASEGNQGIGDATAVSSGLNSKSKGSERKGEGSERKGEGSERKKDFLLQSNAPDAEKNTKSQTKNTTKRTIDSDSSEFPLTQDQKNQIKALQHENDLGLKRLKAEQKVRQKEYDKKEAKWLREKFAELKTGVEKRNCTKERNVRREQFVKDLESERSALVKENQQRIDQLRESFRPQKQPSAAL
jgi:hypothetical protein